MLQLQKKSSKRLISAYNQIMAEMRSAFEQAGPGDTSLQKALDLAKHQVVHFGEVTAEEAHEIGEYIKRDINDAAEYMMEASAEFYDWLMLDIEMIERKVIDLFLSIAEHTRIELERFTQVHSAPERTPVYKSGEITCPGTLICENCATAKTFLSSDQISDCEQCRHHRFIRRLRNDI